MNKKIRENLTLGVFVTLGLIIFVVGVYMVGSRHSLFSRTTNISAIFRDVSGLQPGNNVEFNGINVGTVEKISILSDTAMEVSLAIEKHAAKFIKKDMKATIGSEGLMGNKVISLRGGHGRMAPIEDGDKLATVQPLSMDKIMATMQETGVHALEISRHLSSMLYKLDNGENSFSMLLSDTTLAVELTGAVRALHATGQNALSASRDFASITDRVKRGEGSIGKLLMDETMADNMVALTDSLKLATGKANRAMDNVVTFTDKLNNNRGTVGKLLVDTAMADNIEGAVKNMKQGTEDLDQTVDKLNDSWLLNGVFHGWFSGKDKEKNKKEK